jgi:dTDP-4-dehydrorhamnose 3,5-epimerase-like enzyme
MDGRASPATRTGKAPVFEDPRGSLTLVPYQELPFDPVRVYVLGDIPTGVRRGGHACCTQHRFLVGLSGRATITLDDGRASERVDLQRGDTVHIAPGTWHEIEATTAGVGILVLADGPYDPDDYVTDRSRLPIAAATAAPTADV